MSVPIPVPAPIPASAIYAGTVVHKRLRPRPHAFAYRVFALALDVDAIDDLAARLRLFSRNRFNATSFHDRDHGRGDGTPIAVQIRAALAAAGLAQAGARVTLVCYPRLAGFVFNPLSVYFCYARDGRLAALVYEVTNTFRERTCYVIPVATDATDAGPRDALRQAGPKCMYVSPFTAADARYAFHIRPPGDDLVIGVALRDGEGALLKTHFRGTRRPLTDGQLLAMLARHPLMTLKVVGAIHFEAARLWLKGVPLVPRQPSPPFAIRLIAPGS